MSKVLLSLAILPMMMSAQNPPPSPARPVTDTLHGVSIRDDYRWLEDQTSPETRAWLEAQRAYTGSVLGKIAGRDALRQRISSLMRLDKISSVSVRGGRIFYMKRASDATRWSICYRERVDAEEQVLVDPAAALEGEMSSVSIQAISGGGELLAYGVRAGGADEQQVRFLDVSSRRLLEPVLPASRYADVRISPDLKTVYYADLPNTGPRVFRRSLENGQKGAEQIFGKGYGDTFSADIELSGDGRYLVVNLSEGWTRGWVEMMDTSTGRWSVIGKELGAISTAKPGDGELFMMTSWNAPKRRVFRIDCKRPQQHFWKLVVPEAPEALESVTLAGQRLVLDYVKDAWSMVRFVDRDGKPAGDAGLKPFGTAGVGGSGWKEPGVVISFVSFTTPSEFWYVEPASGAKRLWAMESAPFDGEAVEAKQVWFKSKDGTRVPMFVLAKKGLKLDGERPALLYGYGGFAVNIQPAFSATYATWVENGGVVAVANLRGGAEFGEAWHEAGMLGNKQNVFDDFIAAAEYLVANKYTNPKRLAIMGGSNGGLLVGAVMTQRPELFRAVLCSVPLLDMLRYHKFLLGPLWTPEYGSAENREQFEYIRKYSPYQNVKPGTKYPAVMFKTGDADTRVAPLHARKMTALMQTASKSGLNVLLHYDMSVGHSTGLPVTKEIEDSTDVLSFLMSEIGLALTPAAQ